MSWVVKSTVASSVAMKAHSRSRWAGSSAALGSSSSSSGGSPSSPTAMLSRCRLPPESLPVSASGSSSVSSSIRSTASSGARLQPREQPQVLAHGQLARRPRRAAGPSRPSGRSSVPSSGVSVPARICSSVVLPAPLGPMIATRSPAVGAQRDVAQRLLVAEALADARDVHPGAAAAADAAASRSPSSVPQAGHSCAPAATSAPHSGQCSCGLAAAARGRQVPALELEVPAQVDDRLAQDRGDRERDERARRSRLSGPRAAARRSPGSG